MKTNLNVMKNDKNIGKPTQRQLMKEPESGITHLTRGSESKKLNEETNAIPQNVSILQFPDIDHVKSESTNLIDSSTRQLNKLMKSITKTVVLEDNLFKSVTSVNAACNCAKQISSLLRVKLDIYKEYKKTLK